MSMTYCESCDVMIDTDFNAEHFLSDGETCVEQDNKDSTVLITEDKALEIIALCDEFLQGKEPRLKHVKDVREYVVDKSGVIL